MPFLSSGRIKNDISYWGRGDRIHQHMIDYPLCIFMLLMNLFIFIFSLEDKEDKGD